ncbi:hypothetical protein PGTUg99_006268 [Puccinia graminis f. sp. tritici]|uniref:Uncharacterized protein n=1 Tax=Puccinia graminis f. sp. tritici TaxID=56615 RepID=A0A5B0MJV2_PUCGR|nr:hypothetical protein PGTUg99_006268 [Puccinia graminis f. sp. tritici]
MTRPGFFLLNIALCTLHLVNAAFVSDRPVFRNFDGSPEFLKSYDYDRANTAPECSVQSSQGSSPDAPADGLDLNFPPRIAPTHNVGQGKEIVEVDSPLGKRVRLHSVEEGASSQSLKKPFRQNITTKPSSQRMFTAKEEKLYKAAEQEYCQLPEWQRKYFNHANWHQSNADATDGTTSKPDIKRISEAQPFIFVDIQMQRIKSAGPDSHVRSSKPQDQILEVTKTTFMTRVNHIFEALNIFHRLLESNEAAKLKLGITDNTGRILFDWFKSILLKKMDEILPSQSVNSENLVHISPQAYLSNFLTTKKNFTRKDAQKTAISLMAMFYNECGTTHSRQLLTSNPNLEDYQHTIFELLKNIPNPKEAPEAEISIGHINQNQLHDFFLKEKMHEVTGAEQYSKFLFWENTLIRNNFRSN